MPYQVTQATWLKTEADRVQALLIIPRFWRRAWTDQSLHATLEELGLGYSVPEVTAIVAELRTRGVVEDK